MFCNKAINILKTLYFDKSFWHYYRLDNGELKWPQNKDEAIKISKEELKWILKNGEI